MDITKVDRNFDTSFTAPEDIEWFSARELPFEIFGLDYSEDEGRFIRLPREIAKNTNPGVDSLATHTAGGRLRFATDSPYIAIQVTEPYETTMGHMTIAGKFGFTLFSSNKYLSTFMPTFAELLTGKESGEIRFGGIKTRGSAFAEMTLFFPLYSAVKELYIGIKKGSRLASCSPYKYKKPILFYGSSITQGGCASKPGDDYASLLSRWLDADIINLGFSGSAKGEPVIAEYMAGLDPLIYVIDYDFNAPTAEHLEQTHYPLYQKIREKHESTPIVFITMPRFEGDSNQKRFGIIESTYLRAKEAGDENVYFISGDGFLGTRESGCVGAVDGTHPDSLGFYNMAMKILPTLLEILQKF